MIKRSKLKILLLIIVLLMSSGFRCKCVSPDIAEQLKPITLTYWSVWGDKSKELEEVLARYQSLHPNITVKHRKLRAEEYESMLLNAWAEGRGPDIFSVHNTWVPKYKTKISPMPSKIEMPYVSYEPPLPGCKKKTEEIIEIRQVTVPRLHDIETKYVKTVFHDVVLSDDEGTNRIFALPLSLDTLALFYNVDLLDKDNIPFPPSDWDEFVEDTRLLTRINIDQDIVQAGAALGTYHNVERAFDVFSLLVLQNGGSINDISSAQSIEALEFYLDFANPQKEAYTWNNEMNNSLDAFVEGKLAFFFGYSYHVPMIKSKAPTLNFSVSSVPQINLSSPVNYANYWVETVYSGSKHTKEAWDFILFLSEENNIKSYLKNTKSPTALRGLIKEQQNDPLIYPFVTQVLTADSWHGFKSFGYIENGMEEAFNKIYGPRDDKLLPDYKAILDSLQSKIERAR